MKPMIGDKLSSRERVLLAINHKEADRVPICFREVAPLNKLWKNQFERAEIFSGLGVDEKIRFGLPWIHYPSVSIKHFEETRPEEKYPLLITEWDTPKGILRTVLRKTPDYPFDKAYLVENYNIARTVEYPIKTLEDLEKLVYLLYDPFKVDMGIFKEDVQKIKIFSQDRFMVEATVGYVPSLIAMSVYGLENLLWGVIDKNPLIEELFSMLNKWFIARLKIILEEKPDTVYHMGCYETTDFWSPKIFEKLFFPLLQEEIRLIHEKEAKFHYYTVTGIMPLIDYYKKVDIDILSSLDPVFPGDADLPQIKQRIGDKVCLWGGVNPTKTIEQGTAQEVREAVIQAISSCAKGGGFVLSTAGSIYEDTKKAYDNIMTMIKTCHEFGRYP